jgi:hypothetical protein
MQNQAGWAASSAHTFFDDIDGPICEPSSSSGSLRNKSVSVEQFVSDQYPISEHEPFETYERKLRQCFNGMSETDIATTVPATPSGEPSSIGSLLHASGECRLCWHILESNSCCNGLMCVFCHLAHPVSEQMATTFAGLAKHADLEGGEQSKGGCAKKDRQTKSKRDQYRKAVKKYEEEILQDPLGFKIESVEVPTRIGENPDLKKKFLMRIAAIVDAARVRQSRGAKSHVAMDSADESIDGKSCQTGQIPAVSKLTQLIYL